MKISPLGYGLFLIVLVLVLGFLITHYGGEVVLVALVIGVVLVLLGSFRPPTH
jgi:hypothetical protein